MNIKIVICFIIILFLPVATASTIDNVWIAKSSGYIKSGDSLAFENFLIKVTVLDETRAAITVYKHHNLIETHIFSINETQKYVDTGITLLGIKESYAWVSISHLENKEIWKLFAAKQLKWGEKYTVEDYTIDIDTFGTDSVNLRISKNSITEMYSFSNNSARNYENLRIAVKDINQTGYIQLEIFTKSFSPVKADISTDKDEYFPDEPVQITIDITGDDIQNIVGIYLELDVHAKIYPYVFSLTGVKGKRSFQSQIRELPENTDITISANVETRDYYNNGYVTRVSKVIHVTPEISIAKRIPEDTDEENVTVELHIHNSASSVEIISVYDTVPKDGGDEQLNWRIRLEPSRSTILKYQVSPQKQGQYILPPAMAKWKKKSASSGQAIMTVHRPYIVVSKSSTKNKDLTEVELTMKNTGDRPAQVTISDNIPEGYQVISGETTWSGFLEGGESATIMYLLQGNIENLPPATATYRDIHGVIREAESNVIESSVEYPIDAPDRPVKSGNDNVASPLNVEPYDMVSFMTLSFIVIAGIIGSVVMAAYLSIVFKRG